jgi:hypothetical protein
MQRTECGIENRVLWIGSKGAERRKTIEVKDQYAFIEKSEKLRIYRINNKKI